MILDGEGNFYILEVNSAPSLNTPNIERWSNAFIDYFNEEPVIEEPEEEEVECKVGDDPGNEHPPKLFAS